MNTSPSPSAIQFPLYDAKKAQVLSQHKFALYLAKIKVGVVPVNKFSDAEKTIPIKSPCWNWQACKDKDGYGQFKLTMGKMGKAHRISAFIAGLTGIKSQSDDDNVLHRCDNPSCQNPKHFFIGTHKNNVDDMMEKGRCGTAKLTWEQVKEIRTRYTAGGITTYKLADEFGVVPSLICFIICNKIWHNNDYTPPTKRTRLSKKQRAKVIQLYAKGGTMQKLAKQYNVSLYTIHSIIHKGI